MEGKLLVVVVFAESNGGDEFDESAVNGNNDPDVCDIGIIIDGSTGVNNCPHDRDNEVGDVVEFSECIIGLVLANTLNIRSSLADVDVDP